MYKKPINAPPRWAKCAILSQLNCPTPKNNEMIIITGKRYLALTGAGINININLALGNNVAKAATIPKIAPEAPNIGVPKTLKRPSAFSCIVELVENITPSLYPYADIL